MAASGATAPAPSRTTGPYIGLSYYTEAEAEWFFGRDEDCQTIIANLRAARLTVLYAPSGVGKSSLLRAGVARRLRALGQRQLAQRGSARYVPVVFSGWKDNPVEDLVGAIEAAVQPLLPTGARVELPRHELMAALEQAAATVDAQPLIILDQFEEYLLYRSEEPPERRLVDELSACVNSRSLRANFLIAIREDAYAGLGDLFAGKLLNVYGNYLQLDYLHGDAAREAIIRPIEHFNALHPDDQPIEVEPELVDAVLDEVTTEDATAGTQEQGGTAGNGARAHRDEIEAPYLQLVMSKLWSHERERHSSVLALATLRELGGAREIIRTHLDSALDALTPEEYDTALDVFRYLVTPSGSKIVFTASDLAELVERPHAQVAGLLAKLAAEDKRIVRHVPPPAGRSKPSDRYEIYHDVLAPAIIAWRHRILDERRRSADIRERERLEREKREADAKAREEERRRRAFQRLSAGALALLLVAVVLGIIALVEKSRAVRNLHAAQSSQLVAGAEQTLSSDPALSTLLALRALHVKYTPQAEAALREALPQLQELKALPVGSPVNSAVFSPDATKVLTASEHGTAIIWDLASGRRVRTLDGGHGIANGAAFSADGTKVVTATKDGTARVWDAVTGKELSELRGNSGAVNSAAFNPNGTDVVTATEGGAAIIWNARTGARGVTLQEHGPAASVESAAFSPDGTKVVTASARGTTTVWDAQTGRPLISLPARGAQGAAFSPDGAKIVTAGARGTARIWDWRSGEQGPSMSVQGAILDAAFSPDGTEVVTANQNGTADVWDASSGRQLTALSGGEGPVRGAVFSPDGHEVVTAGADGAARIWHATPPELRGVLRGKAGEVLSAAFNASGSKVVTANQNLTASIWSLTSARTQPVTLRGDEGPIQSAEFSRDGARVVSASTDGTARIWDSESGQPLAILRGHDGPVRTAAFSPNGDEIVTADKGGTAIIWDAHTHQQRSVLRRPGRPARMESATFSPDGATVVTTSEDGSATLWDATSGKPRRTWSASAVAVLYAAFSPDGTKLVTASKDGTASIWDTAGKHLLMTLRGEAGPIYNAAFSPDGSEVVTPGEAGRVSVWNAQSGKRLTVLAGREGVVFSAAFSPDGREIVTANQDGSATIWYTELAGPLESLERIAETRDKRMLTAAERSTYLVG